MSLLEVKNLKKQFNQHYAVNDISFTIDEGDVYGILGPNGAGKSTTIEMLVGLLNVDEGEIIYEGQYPPKTWHAHIGLAPQDLAIYPELSAEENIHFFASLYGMKGEELTKAVAESLKFVGLEEAENKRTKDFSGGMKRRLNLACALTHSPRLLILDEPTVGVDPQSRNYILTRLKELQTTGTTILYTSHYMEEVEFLCNKVLIMDEGKIIANDSIENLEATANEKNQTVQIRLEEIFLEMTGKELRDQ